MNIQVIMREKMNESFEYKGTWWLPENQERKVAGTLKYSPEDGPVLELIGSFWDLPGLQKAKGPNVILGKSDNGKLITLFYYRGRRDEMSWPGLTRTTVRMQIIFVGYHFFKREDLVFDSLSVNYNYLNDWCGEYPFSVEWDIPKSYKVNYQQPEPLIIELKEFKISLEPELSVNHQRAGDINLKYFVYLKIEGNKKNHFEDLMNFMEKLRNFISLGVKRPIYSNGVKVKTDKYVIKGQDGKELNPLIDVFYKKRRKEYKEKTLIPSDFLFSFNDIKSQFKNCLEKWIEIDELIKPVKDLYFGTLYNPRMFLENKFLNLTQALETYHSRIYKESYSINPKDFGEIFEKILEVIPSKHKKYFEEKLKYTNEYSLRKRVKEIIKKSSSIVEFYLSNNREKKSFVNNVVNTRNYLIHYDEKLKNKVAKGEDLYWLNLKLKILVEIVLMKEIGIDSKYIINALKRNTEYQEIWTKELKGNKKRH